MSLIDIHTNRATTEKMSTKTFGWDLLRRSKNLFWNYSLLINHLNIWRCEMHYTFSRVSISGASIKFTTALRRPSLNKSTALEASSDEIFKTASNCPPRSWWLCSARSATRNRDFLWSRISADGPPNNNCSPDPSWSMMQVTHKSLTYMSLTSFRLIWQQHLAALSRGNVCVSKTIIHQDLYPNLVFKVIELQFSPKETWLTE